ncbi:hypothetical protein NQ315_015471 [Exocentrus adspersus]|uniref:Transmembrane protein 183 n=1 Tax=Exocentrus adspersus TaxID=1586481 RepID=A0AAV8VM16_9CUCU|nr:hypothetical protein NQ315_015471 [Exocentrus adspersus]
MSHKKSGRNRSAKSLGDITLNDFANAAVSKTRLKKSTSNVTTVLKKFEEEKSWDEKIEDDFQGDFVEEIDEEGNVSFVIRKVEPRRRRKTVSCSDETKDAAGNDYPIDIWFLLSEYIRPEDVGRFAGICKTSFEVVCTAKFWFGLYKRYYTNVPNVPDELQPECLVRKYSLRTSVVRALHYTYTPFVNKLKSIKTAVEEHPDTLIRRLCDCMWHQRQKGHWVYYFKMREKRSNCLQHSTRGSCKQPDLLEILDDVTANPDENCRVLQVTCQHFIQTPPVIGQVLTSVCLTLSQGFRHHRLQLGFGSGIKGYPSPEGSGSTKIILDPVINFRVLDWWHPLYPHNHTIQDLLNRE